MADVFGDLDLFSEFEKHREAHGSFIHYDEDGIKSRIVFEDYADDQGSDSENDFDSEIREEFASSKTASGGKAGAAYDHGGAGGDAAVGGSTSREHVECKDTFENDAANSMDVESRDDKESGESLKQSKARIQKDDSDLPSTNKNSNGAPDRRKADTDELTTENAEAVAWLNEQLYAEAAEEAKSVSTSTQQLIYERNKYRRYAKILDSTRYVPDDDSPAVQLIFNNNSFARKYRQQIEQFIKSLLWEELHSTNHDTVPEITVKPGAPSCIDINCKLPPEKRRENMRQKHAVIGNSQFHKQFLIDFLGWPFTVPEPTRCNFNWEIPLYGQVFNEVYADPTNKPKKATKKSKPACWNCGEENHAVSECKQPRNPTKISANRREFLAQQQQNHGNSEPKFTGPARYHLDPDLSSEFLKFKPGVVSEPLRQALGLTQDQLPQHIYKMRLFGYPPGWLAEARQIQSGVNIFDKNGRVTLITGECLEDGELAEDGAVEKPTEYDVNKIIEFPGFTVPVPLGFIDEHAVFKMPPIQQHQLKKTLMTQTTDKTSVRKRKREKNQDENEEIKKVKTDEPGQEEGEIHATVTDEGEMSGEKSKAENNLDKETTEDSTEMAAPSPTQIPEVRPASVLSKSSSTISLSRDYGTPVFEREKSGLPDASRFGQGIEEHIPYENLPNSTGTFDKMRELIEAMRKKSKK